MKSTCVVGLNYVHRLNFIFKNQQKSIGGHRVGFIIRRKNLADRAVWEWEGLPGITLTAWATGRFRQRQKTACPDPEAGKKGLPAGPAGSQWNAYSRDLFIENEFEHMK